MLRLWRLIAGDLLLFETVLVLLALAVALMYPQLGESWFEWVERVFGRLARRRGLAILFVVLVGLGARAALLPWLPIPAPAIHDEFSYLLAADTFAHGRLTNPTHPMWVHFETFHVIQKPSYQSMYFPAQGLVLAAGQQIAGEPFVGVWLSVGAMCGAICWMLQGFLPPGWALLGGLLAVMRFGVFNYWADSYWGGAVPAVGGALALGAFARIRKKPRVSSALWMGLGLAILASSRPYEGLVFSVPVGVALVAWLFGKKRPPFKISLWRVVVPVTMVLILTAAGLGYYSWRVTGSPLETPYGVNLATYNPVPFFLWQPPRPFPVYHHEVLRRFYEDWALPQYLELRSPSEAIAGVVLRWFQLWAFFLGPALSFPFLAASLLVPRPVLWRALNPMVRLLSVVLMVSLAGFAVEVYFHPHYAAPLTGLLLGLAIQCMRHLRLWEWRGRRAGLFLTRVVPLIGIIMLFWCPRVVRPETLEEEGWPDSWCAPSQGDQGRARIFAQLEKMPGRQLVIVRYGEDHDVHREWVYNAADIDSSKVVWARDVSPQQNAKLFAYFKDRQIWLVEPDTDNPELIPYPLSGAPPDR